MGHSCGLVQPSLARSLSLDRAPFSASGRAEPCRGARRSAFPRSSFTSSGMALRAARAAVRTRTPTRVTGRWPVVTSYNTNFPRRNDSHPTTMNFIARPELSDRISPDRARPVSRFALRGPRSDRRLCRCSLRGRWQKAKGRALRWVRHSTTALESDQGLGGPRPLAPMPLPGGP
jgi:hypothetical protein